MADRKKPTTRRTRWGDNVVMADFGAKRRQELKAGRREPRMPVGEQESWGAAQLMEALATRTDSGRLARGREYYRAGRVIGVEMGRNQVTGLVKGTQLEPFDVHIRLAPMGKRQWAFVEQELLLDSSHLLSLGRGGAPGSDVAAILFRPDQLASVSCTCPDKSLVCKHVVSVGYSVASQLSKEPLQVLRLRGLEPEPFLAHMGMRNEPAAVRPLHARPVEVPEEDSGKRLPELVDPVKFWGDVQAEVEWEPLDVEIGMEQGDHEAIMTGLRTVSWTGVDQLRAHFELEKCYEALTEGEHVFDNLPWMEGKSSQADDRDEDHE